jgi:hypothetical protein
MDMRPLTDTVSIPLMIHECVLSTEHELIPATDASLAVRQVSASGSNVRYYPTRKHSLLK